MKHCSMLWLLLVTGMLLPGRAGATNVMVTAGAGGNYFSPAAVTIDPGDTITWVWVNGHHNTSGLGIPAGAVSWYAPLTASDSAFSYIPQVSGLYTYTCTHHSGMDGQFYVTGCSYPGRPVIQAPATEACDGDTLLLSIASQPGASFQWLEGGTLLPGADSASLPVVHSGSYRAVVSRCGVDSISLPFAVLVHSLPAAAITSSGSWPSYTFTGGPGTGPYHYRWAFGDGSPEQQGQQAAHTFSASGSYLVSLEVTDTLTGCQDMASLLLESPAGIVINHLSGQRVYPNPASAVLCVDAPADVSFSLYELSGRAVTLIPQPGIDHCFSVGGLPPGAYLLLIQTMQGRAVHKVLIGR